MSSCVFFETGMFQKALMQSNVEVLCFAHSVKTLLP